MLFTITVNYTGIISAIRHLTMLNSGKNAKKIQIIFNFIVVCIVCISNSVVVCIRSISTALAKNVEHDLI